MLAGQLQSLFLHEIGVHDVLQTITGNYDPLRLENTASSDYLLQMSNQSKNSSSLRLRDLWILQLGNIKMKGSEYFLLYFAPGSYNVDLLERKKTNT
ncbi:unnamed protein product [Schistosoma mattheei]|uniref:Ovule protein n=1 Tax=Schistosoma mattheei TaxID=31246 RepID=A0A183P383_9TREM|nr:unnamed protein product [Schistosoma mattheei]VDP46626.1 unnamed protein product [Schistosoma mattheei]